MMYVGSVVALVIGTVIAEDTRRMSSPRHPTPCWDPVTPYGDVCDVSQAHRCDQRVNDNGMFRCNLM